MVIAYDVPRMSAVAAALYLQRAADQPPAPPPEPAPTAEPHFIARHRPAACTVLGALRMNPASDVSIPDPPFAVTGADLLNCIDWGEFNALIDWRQQNVLLMCACSGLLTGVPSQVPFGMLLAYFPADGPTVAALRALS
jgi:hypothetical protein